MPDHGPNLRPFFFVVGATCTGKTRLAIALARRLGEAPVLNADSLQVFDGLDIGTAKPNPEEQSTVPHKLFGHVGQGLTYSVADYLQDAVAAVPPEGPVVFCGGSGFYIQALVKGLYPNVETPAEVKKRVENLVQTGGFPELFRVVQAADPEHAAKIAPQDHYRLRRAVEILWSQDQTVTSLKAKMARDARSPLPAHAPCSVGLYYERREQRSLVHRRTEAMLQSGFIDEVQRLIDAGHQDWAPLRSVGYKEVCALLAGEIPRRDLAERITTSTMQLIKKQTTWFKKQEAIRWFHGEKWLEALEYACDQHDRSLT